jgi:hypothetical protein
MEANLRVWANREEDLNVGIFVNDPKQIEMVK